MKRSRLTTVKRALYVLMLLSLMLAILPISVVAKGNKVDICHRNENGEFHLINVAESAVPAHLAHGDGKPGDLVPGMEGFKFGEDCTLQEITRYVDNGNGTVTDTQTGLLWLKDAACWGIANNWWLGTSLAAGLKNGDCGLTDGSVPGDWRLPTIAEWMATVELELECTNPSLANTPGTGCYSDGPQPFINVGSWHNTYWSSTELGGSIYENICLTAGTEGWTYGGYAYGIWPVRGGQ